MTKNYRSVVFILLATALVVAAIGLYVGFRSGEYDVPWRKRVSDHEFPRALPEPQVDGAVSVPEGE